MLSGTVMTGKGDAEEALSRFRGDDLKLLCEMFELPVGGSNPERISRLVGLGENSYSRLVALSRQVVFGYAAEDHITIREIKSVISAAGLRASGNKHDLFMAGVTGDIAPACKLLTIMGARHIRKTYKRLFKMPPVASESELRKEMLNWLGCLPPGASVSSAYPWTLDPDLSSSHSTPSPEKASQVSADNQELDHYDVAISYAGEDTVIAEELANAMKAVGVTVYIALERQSDLWGKDLETEFRRVFGPKATFVVVLVSQHYPHKDFTDFELTIARDEALRRKEEFILPVRLDDTKILGLRSSICYADYRQKSAKKIAEMTKEKLSKRKSRPAGLNEEPRLRRSDATEHDSEHSAVAATGMLGGGAKPNMSSYDESSIFTMIGVVFNSQRMFLSVFIVGLVVIAMVIFSRVLLYGSIESFFFVFLVAWLIAAALWRVLRDLIRI